MIFVTVGTQLPFDRLLKTMDEWAEDHTFVDVFAQTGATHFSPRRMQGAPNLDSARFREKFSESRVVVSHAGTGNILLAMEMGKPIVLLPRRAALKEHRNDHQLATIASLKDRPGIWPAENETDIAPILERVLNGRPIGETSAFRPYASEALLEATRAFIHSS